MVPRNLAIVREAGGTILHAPEDEGVVIGESKDLRGSAAGVEMEKDFGAHGYREAYGRRVGSSMCERDGLHSVRHPCMGMACHCP